MKTCSIYCSLLFFVSLCLGLALSKHYFGGHNALSRFPRASPDNNSPNDCRYDKGPWQECDALNGKQKRILTLRAPGAVNNDCPQEKFIERPCKKQCKYSKGVWSECTNGAKERVDKLKAEVSTAGCKSEKQITKQCKKQCSYEKSQWTTCENGIKTKTLTLVDGGNSVNSPDCEQLKTITKPCPKGAKQKRFRKKNREQAES